MYPHSRPRHSNGFFIALAIVVISIGFFSRDAFADHQREKIDVAFETLSAKYDGDKLVVRYEIKRKHWKRLRRSGIEPKINMYGYSPKHGSKFLRQVRIDQREGKVFAKPDRLRGDEIQIRLVGSSQTAFIGDLGYHRQCASKLNVQLVRTYKQKLHHGWKRSEFDAMKSVCAKYYVSHKSCFAMIQKTGKRSPSVFEACDDAVQWSSEFKQCVASASRLKRRPANIVRACSSSTEWFSDFNACMKLATNINAAPARTIKACSTATEWQSDFRNCVKVAGTYTDRPDRVIAACDENTEWASDFNRCLKKAKVHGPDAAAIVNSCGAWTEWTSDFNRCIERGGLAKKKKRSHKKKRWMASRW